MPTHHQSPFFGVVFLVLALTSAFVVKGSNDHQFLAVVDASGNGDHAKIQDAIDAVPSNTSQRIFILVKPGIYREKIVVPYDKPFLTLSGYNASDTILEWADNGDIFRSPTVSVLADGFMARYVTIQNSYGVGAKAVALRVSGDRAVFVGCRILSRQDTLLDDRGRHYYSHCYIEGDVDFIFGNGASIFRRCHLHSLAQGNGAITAQRRQSVAEETGFTFLYCKITGVKTAVLGRPWGVYSRVVFAHSYMSNVVLPQGWDDWGDTAKHMTVYYGEYNCYGPGAEASRRVKWSRNLSEQEATPFFMAAEGSMPWIRSMMSHFPRVNAHRRINGSSCSYEQRCV